MAYRKTLPGKTLSQTTAVKTGQDCGWNYLPHPNHRSERFVLKGERHLILDPANFPTMQKKIEVVKLTK